MTSTRNRTVGQHNRQRGPEVSTDEQQQWQEATDGGECGREEMVRRAGISWSSLRYLRQSKLFSGSQFDLLARHIEQPGKYHYVRYQKQRHKKGGDIPGPFQVRHSLGLAQCIEQIQATHHVEHPYQRQCQDPAITQRNQAGDRQ